jgi:hypothetical protein
MEINDFIKKGIEEGLGITFDDFKKDNPILYSAIKSIIINSNKFHIEKALKSASDNVKINEMKNYSCAIENMIVSDTSFSNDDYEYYIDKNSILNSYPLTNIK